MSETTRRQLGEFLKSRRQRIQPQLVGLPTGPRRRTVGLRREEVAELASISTDWYTRIEQGRSVTPSPETVNALARALRLTETEHAHLRALAGNPHGHNNNTDVPPDVRRLMQALTQPAYVTGPRWDVLEWNHSADELFGFSSVPPTDRNTLVLMLTRPASRELFGDRWAGEARRMTAQFRATHDLMADDPAIQELTRRLSRESPEFAGWWSTHEIREIGPGTKWLHRPDNTTIGYEYTTLHPTEHPTLKVVVYTPVLNERVIEPA